MGFINKRGPGQYRARYRAPGGQERSRTFERRADAERFLASVEADKARGVWVDPRLGRTLYRDWADRWLRTTVHLKPKTQAGYESLLRSHVLPTFGQSPLHAIRLLEVREWIAAMRARGLSASRVRQARQVLFATLQLAVESGIVASNAATGAKVPREPTREMRYLTVEQLERLAAATRAPYDILIYVLGYGGLRWGEAVALRRARVDLLGSNLHVRESLAEVGGNLHWGATKTHRGRVVAIPRFLRSLLEQHLASAVRPEEDALVFQGPSGGPLLHSNFSRHLWRPAVVAAGLPSDLRMHELRHTTATLLIDAGAHPKAIQQQLGHSSITVTLDTYGHLFPSHLGELAERLEESRSAILQRTAASARPTDVTAPRPA